VILILHKNHPAFDGPDGGLLEDNMQQSLLDNKLSTGLLAGTFDLRDKKSRSVIARTLLSGSGRKPELLIGGILKEVQSGLTKEADARVRASLRHDFAVENGQDPPRPRELDHRPQSGLARVGAPGGGFYDGP
jgi:hypothetical protein